MPASSSRTIRPEGFAVHFCHRSQGERRSTHGSRVTHHVLGKRKPARCLNVRLRLNVQVPTVLQPGATKQSGNTIKYFGSDIGVCSSRTQGPKRTALGLAYTWILHT